MVKWDQAANTFKKFKGGRIPGTSTHVYIAAWDLGGFPVLGCAMEKLDGISVATTPPL